MPKVATPGREFAPSLFDGVRHDWFTSVRLSRAVAPLVHGRRRQRGHPRRELRAIARHRRRRRRIPQPNRGIIAGRRQQLAVGRERDAPDGPEVARQHLHRASLPIGSTKKNAPAASANAMSPTTPGELGRRCELPSCKFHSEISPTPAVARNRSSPERRMDSTLRDWCPMTRALSSSTFQRNTSPFAAPTKTAALLREGISVLMASLSGRLRSCLPPTGSRIPKLERVNVGRRDEQPTVGKQRGGVVFARRQQLAGDAQALGLRRQRLHGRQSLPSSG